MKSKGFSKEYAEMVLSLRSDGAFRRAMLLLFLTFSLAVALGGRLFYEWEQRRLHGVSREGLATGVAGVGRSAGSVVLLGDEALKAILFRFTGGFLVLLTSFAFFSFLISRRRAVRLNRLLESQRNIVFALASLAELRDQTTGKHLERTRSYGVILCGELRKLVKYRQIIDDRYIDGLYDAAPLHDIGKVAVPDQVLLKPAAHTAEESVLMRRHVEVGRQILARIIGKLDEPLPFLIMSQNIAFHHHEKYDGSGYPLGLSGDAIPLEARIFSLGDSYDAIRARRPYKEPVTHMEAVQRLYAGRGNQFDPDVVNAFLACEEHFLELYESYQVYDEIYLGISDLKGDSGPAVVWSSEFEVGVELIDGQHRELFNRINKLLAAIREGKGWEETSGLMRFLQEYVVEHFRAEEGLMLRHGYTGFATHKQLHDDFIAEMGELADSLEKNGVDSALVVAVNQKVLNWIVAHIFMVDKGLRNCLVV